MYICIYLIIMYRRVRLPCGSETKTYSGLWMLALEDIKQKFKNKHENGNPEVIYRLKVSKI